MKRLGTKSVVFKWLFASESQLDGGMQKVRLNRAKKTKKKTDPNIFLYCLPEKQVKSTSSSWWKLDKTVRADPREDSIFITFGQCRNSSPCLGPAFRKQQKRRRRVGPGGIAHFSQAFTWNGKGQAKGRRIKWEKKRLVKGIKSPPVIWSKTKPSHSPSSPPSLILLFFLFFLRSSEDIAAIFFQW